MLERVPLDLELLKSKHALEVGEDCQGLELESPVADPAKCQAESEGETYQPKWVNDGAR